MSIIETTATAAESASENLSLRDFVLAAREEAQRDKTVDLAIPGYEGKLWGRFRPLKDSAVLREIVAHAREETGDDDGLFQKYVAADTLIRACVDTYALRDGEEQPLGKKLGLELTAYLGLEGADTDRQAVFVLIAGPEAKEDNTTALVATYARYDAWVESTLHVGIRAAEGKSERRA